MLKKISEHEYVAYNANGREYPVLVYLKDEVEMFRFSYIINQVANDTISADSVSRWCIHQKVAYVFVNPYRWKDYFSRPKDVYRFYKARFQNLWYKHTYELGKADA